MTEPKAFDRSGIILINKEAGISSNKIVNLVKHALNAKKCGHLGTLDLEGEGLLPVTVNKATKLFDYFLKKDKTYETIFVFGFETDTLDTSGKIIKEKQCYITKEEVEKAIKTMIGKYEQMPPQYSAKKVNGKTAYKEARRGEVVQLKPKQIEIFDFKLLEVVDKNKFKFEISCSSGTYIRSVCRDLAEKLSTYGSMQCILRTRCGGFKLKDAFNIEDVKAGNYKLISCDSLFDFSTICLLNDETEKLLNGQHIFFEKENGRHKLYNEIVSEINFLGIGEISENVLELKLRLV